MRHRWYLLLESYILGRLLRRAELQVYFQLFDAFVFILIALDCRFFAWYWRSFNFQNAWHRFLNSCPVNFPLLSQTLCWGRGYLESRHYLHLTVALAHVLLSTCVISTGLVAVVSIIVREDQYCVPRVHGAGIELLLQLFQTSSAFVYNANLRQINLK